MVKVALNVMRAVALCSVLASAVVSTSSSNNDGDRGGTKAISDHRHREKLRMNKGKQVPLGKRTATETTTIDNTNVQVSNNDDVQVLIYETTSAKVSHERNVLDQLARLDGIQGKIFGEGTTFEGFGSKYTAVLPVLEEMDPETLVVISDGRDVLINTSTDSHDTTSAVKEFRENFHRLTKDDPGSIVISAEAQCCVSALTHVEPGEYYNADGTRNKRSCPSGEKGCRWAGDEKALPWEDFMRVISIERTGENYDDVYLNAGLMVGKAQDLLQIIKEADIDEDEDDQAVWTDYMFHKSNKVVLDYGQNLFGNNRGGLGGIKDGTCVFDFQNDSHDRLVHLKTGSVPLFLHSPGKYFECQDSLAAKLGIIEDDAIISQHRRLRQLNQNYGNYGGGNYGSGDGCDGFFEDGSGCEHDGDYNDGNGLPPDGDIGGPEPVDGGINIGFIEEISFLGRKLVGNFRSRKNQER